MAKTRAKSAHVWERDPHDWYVEPSRVTTQLCAVETFRGTIHDPTCGRGNIVTGLRAAGYQATGSDLVERPGQAAPWFLGTMDFLNGWAGLYGADNCVFNPPFYEAKGIEACIRRALDLAPGKVAAFADTKFLGGGARASGLWRDHPPQRVWLITPRPSCPPGAYLEAGGPVGGGSADWCWIVWDERPRRDTSAGMARLGWLR